MFLFSAFVIDFYITLSKVKTKKNRRHFFTFAAGRDIGSKIRIRGGMGKFCFRQPISFSTALTPKLKQKQSATKIAAYFSVFHCSKSFVNLTAFRYSKFVANDLFWKGERGCSNFLCVCDLRTYMPYSGDTL